MSCLEIGTVDQESYVEFCQRVNGTPEPLSPEERKVVGRFIRFLVSNDRYQAKLYRESLDYIDRKKTDEEELSLLEIELNRKCGIL